MLFPQIAKKKKEPRTEPRSFLQTIITLAKSDILIQFLSNNYKICVQISMFFSGKFQNGIFPTEREIPEKSIKRWFNFNTVDIHIK